MDVVPQTLGHVMPKHEAHQSRMTSTYLQPIQARILDESCPCRIRHGFFTREGGVSKGIYHALNLGLGSQDNAEDVTENRRRVSAFFGVEESCLLTMYQTHSTDVVVVDSPSFGACPKADALVSNVPGLVLGVLTADCAPVLFVDKARGIIGAAHAGWRGALKGILENTLAAMVALGACKQDIVAVVGPSIGPRSYEVGAEFLELFLDSTSGNMVYFTTLDKGKHYFFNLWAYIVARLEQTGIEVLSLNLCTYENEERFYSYRRKTHLGHEDYGRQISAIMLET